MTMKMKGHIIIIESLILVAGLTLSASSTPQPARYEVAKVSVDHIEGRTLADLCLLDNNDYIIAVNNNEGGFNTYRLKEDGSASSIYGPKRENEDGELDFYKAHVIVARDNWIFVGGEKNGSAYLKGIDERDWPERSSWSHHFSETENSYFNHLLFTPDGDIVAGGETFHPERGDKMLVFLRSPIEGGLSWWDFNYPTPQNFYELYSMKNLTDEWVLALSKMAIKFEEHSPSDDPAFERTLLVEMNKHKVVVQKLHELDSKPDNTTQIINMLTDAVIKDDGNRTTYVGYVTNDLYFEKVGTLFISGGRYDTDLWDKDKWDVIKVFGGPTESVERFIHETDDGHYLIGGLIEKLDDGSYTYVIKIDKQGNLIWSDTSQAPLEEVTFLRKTDESYVLMLRRNAQTVHVIELSKHAETAVNDWKLH